MYGIRGLCFDIAGLTLADLVCEALCCHSQITHESCFMAPVLLQKGDFHWTLP